jgi:hypothetical protein
MPSIEEDYLDVLQNIESAIISVYRENPDALDYDVDKAIHALWMEYRAEKQGKTNTPPYFNANAQLVYERVKLMCEWRLGRRKLEAENNGQPASLNPEPLTMDEITACLKRIRKSIDLWTKQGGRQGYLYFIDNNAGM